MNEGKRDGPKESRRREEGGELVLGSFAVSLFDETYLVEKDVCSPQPLIIQFSHLRYRVSDFQEPSYLAELDVHVPTDYNQLEFQ